MGGGATVNKGGEVDGDLIVGTGRIDDSSSTSIGTAGEVGVGGVGITPKVAVVASVEVVVGDCALSGGEGDAELGAASGDGPEDGSVGVGSVGVESVGIGGVGVEAGAAP